MPRPRLQRAATARPEKIQLPIEEQNFEESAAAAFCVSLSLQVPPYTHILLARSPAPYSPFRHRDHSPTAFSGLMTPLPPTPLGPPPSHARGMDGFCNHNADELGSLAGLYFPAVYVGVVECMPTSLPLRPPPPSHIHFLLFVSARTNKRQHHHTRRMDGFCKQNANQLGCLAGLSFPAAYVGVVECAPASP